MSHTARVPLASGNGARPSAPAPPHRPHEDDEFWREGRIRFRVQIGAIGHLDLLRTDELVQEIQNDLELIESRFSSRTSTEVHFTVLSSLAEGADRLVVQQALDRFGAGRVELHAVLPLEEDEYRRDFSDEDSRDTFDRLLAQATTVTRMPHTPDRDEAYERAGRWLAEHSDALIALWDGRNAGGRGGTSEIARYAHCRGVPVLVVPTARASHPEREPLPAPWTVDLAKELGSAFQACDRIEEFNRRSVRDGTLRRAVRTADARLSAAADRSAIHWQYELVAQWALPRLARADALAMCYQRRYYRAGQRLYALAALAVTVVAAQATAGISDLVALVEVMFMAGLFLVYRSAHKVGLQERWIGYRSLAEAFRAALFIVMTGAPARKNSAASDLGAEEAWFQRAFSEAWHVRPVSDDKGRPLPVKRHARDTADLRRFLIEAWIDDQVAYHRGAVTRFQRGYKRLTRTIFVLFSLTIVIGLMHAFEVVPGEDWRHLFIFLAVALPSFGAALTGIRDLRQFRRHADRSARTANRLRQLKRNMESQKTLRSVQKLAAQVQSVIQTENSDWLDVIEFQDLEMII